MSAPPVPGNVRAAFAALPARLQPRLAELRALLFDVAAGDARIGALTETLKWGEPAYLTEATRAGSTIRLGRTRQVADHCALLFNCNRSLVEGFRTRFPELTFEGNRAVLIHPAAPIPLAVPLCVAAALTYHLDRSRRSA